ncbi:unnamed protein product [Mycetohabitans rhizoxinica HKI 454]|uniref:Uncharacterized protein n=1 Tax=Mycetohabitans rhizoxinica (strain DSM 19002 / CIP 109453 / HKI 454) TaxID=882378 RepID=E5AS90_MYCRK|nr:unnamed protein product [Mycetohabitans rhizoxinica HKI 454]
MGQVGGVANEPCHGSARLIGKSVLPERGAWHAGGRHRAATPTGADHSPVDFSVVETDSSLL